MNFPAPTSVFRPTLVALALLLIVASAPAPALALGPDELLLVVNNNVPASREVAEFYARARLIPDGRIVGLDLPPAEELPFENYEADVVPPIRKFIDEHGLRGRIKCLVTFYGVPIRILGKVSSPEDKQELAGLKQQVAATQAKLVDVVGRAEQTAKELDPTFSPPGDKAEDVANRADEALRAIVVSLSRMEDRDLQRKHSAALVQLIREMGGAERTTQLMATTPALRRLLPGEPVLTPEQAAEVSAKVLELKERRYDAAARKQMLEIAEASSGLFGLARLQQGMLDYLDNDGTSAAFDSELALLWWDFYPRSKWQINPMNYHFVHRQLPPAVMTARIDGPTEEVARRIVTDSLRAEQRGLEGGVVIDTRGKRLRGPQSPAAKADGYAQYDQSLRNFATIVKGGTNLSLTFDEKEEVLPAESAKDVALYCGWYSLRNYVPSAKFSPGAVGFHVASFEMVSLRLENERGWVAGLLNNGVAATLGPVAEPYLHAFPAADEFFPILMTGKLPLVEVYWRTAPTASWMLSLVGDPLYTPYAKNPPLTAETLPAPLRAALVDAPARHGGGAPATVPAAPASPAVTP